MTAVLQKCPQRQSLRKADPQYIGRSADMQLDAKSESILDLLKWLSGTYVESWNERVAVYCSENRSTPTQQWSSNTWLSEVLL